MATDKKFIVWHVIFTVILAAWSLMLLFSDGDCIGREPGYWIIVFGVLPSLVLLRLGFRRPLLAYKVAMGYGALVAVLSAILIFVAYGFLWVVVFFPVFGFIAEGLYIYWRWNVLRNLD